MKDYKPKKDFDFHKYIGKLGYSITMWPDCSYHIFGLNISPNGWYPYITNYGGEKEDKIINELLEKGLIEEVIKGE